MKAFSVEIAVAVVICGFLAGCESPGGGPNNTGTGALVGGASGAALGAAVAGCGEAGAGALIGGAAGLLVGGLVGHSMDQQAQARIDSVPPPMPSYTPAPSRPVAVPAPAAPVYSPPPVVPPTTIEDVKAMARAGTPDDVIIAQINTTHAAFNLDSNALIDLHNAGVSERVITYMINTSQHLAPKAPRAQQFQKVALAQGTPSRQAVWVSAHWVRDPYGWHQEGGYWK